MVLQPSLSWRYIICAGFELRTTLLVQEFDSEGKGNTFVDGGKRMRRSRSFLVTYKVGGQSGLPVCLKKKERRGPSYF